jgi:hypothetical protein
MRLLVDYFIIKYIMSSVFDFASCSISFSGKFDMFNTGIYHPGVF